MVRYGWVSDGPVNSREVASFYSARNSSLFRTMRKEPNDEPNFHAITITFQGFRLPFLRHYRHLDLPTNFPCNKNSSFQNTFLNINKTSAPKHKKHFGNNWMGSGTIFLSSSSGSLGYRSIIASQASMKASWRPERPLESLKDLLKALLKALKASWRPPKSLKGLLKAWRATWKASWKPEGPHERPPESLKGLMKGLLKAWKASWKPERPPWRPWRLR